MKKFLTLILALGSLSFAFAQGGRPYDSRSGSRTVVLGPGYGSNDRGYGRYGMSERDRDEQIRHINQAYEWRIRDVERNRYLRHGERKRQIRALERQRAEEIRQVNQRFLESRNHGNRGRNERRGW